MVSNKQSKTICIILLDTNYHEFAIMEIYKVRLFGLTPEQTNQDFLNVL